MSVTKAERVIRALEEAADALEDAPGLRRQGLFIAPITPASLRAEAAYIKGLVWAATEVAKP